MQRPLRSSDRRINRHTSQTTSGPWAGLARSRISRPVLPRHSSRRAPRVRTGNGRCCPAEWSPHTHPGIYACGRGWTCRPLAGRPAGIRHTRNTGHRSKRLRPIVRSFSGQKRHFRGAKGVGARARRWRNARTYLGQSDNPIVWVRNRLPFGMLNALRPVPYYVGPTFTRAESLGQLSALGLHNGRNGGRACPAQSQFG